MDDQTALIKYDVEKWFNKNPVAAKHLVKLGLLNTTRGNKKKDLSLRKLDFLFTSLTKREGKSSPSLSKIDFPVNLILAYKQARHVHRKKRLDAFKRAARQPFNIDGRIVHSTLGQVNFFRLIFEHDAIDFVMNNINKIENEMKVAIKEKKEAKSSHENTKPASPRKTAKRKSETQVCFGHGKRPKLETNQMIKDENVHQSILST